MPLILNWNKRKFPRYMSTKARVTHCSLFASDDVVQILKTFFVKLFFPIPLVHLLVPLSLSVFCSFYHSLMPGDTAFQCVRRLYL